jgi:hypothetical protein
MPDKVKTIRATVDTYTKVCLTSIVILLTILIVGLWANEVPMASQAQAAGNRQGPFIDSSTQNQLINVVEAQEKTTEKIKELISVMQSGNAKVQVIIEQPAQAGNNRARNAAPKPKK